MVHVSDEFDYSAYEEDEDNGETFFPSSTSMGRGLGPISITDVRVPQKYYAMQQQPQQAEIRIGRGRAKMRRPYLNDTITPGHASSQASSPLRTTTSSLAPSPTHRSTQADANPWRSMSARAAQLQGSPQSHTSSTQSADQRHCLTSSRGRIITGASRMLGRNVPSDPSLFASKNDSGSDREASARTQETRPPAPPPVNRLLLPTNGFALPTNGFAWPAKAFAPPTYAFAPPSDEEFPPTPDSNQLSSGEKHQQFAEVREKVKKLIVEEDGNRKTDFMTQWLLGEEKFIEGAELQARSDTPRITAQQYVDQFLHKVDNMQFKQRRSSTATKSYASLHSSRVTVEKTPARLEDACVLVPGVADTVESAAYRYEIQGAGLAAESLASTEEQVGVEPAAKDNRDVHCCEDSSSAQTYKVCPEKDRTVYIENLPFKDSRSLEDYFISFGEVEKLRIYGNTIFVTYTTTQAHDWLIECINGQTDLFVDQDLGIIADSAVNNAVQFHAAIPISE